MEYREMLTILNEANNSKIVTRNGTLSVIIQIRYHCQW